MRQLLTSSHRFHRFHRRTRKSKKIEQIPIDAPWTANMCFGGKDHRTLFITAMQNLFSLRMRVKGAGSQ